MGGATVARATRAGGEGVGGGDKGRADSHTSYPGDLYHRILLDYPIPTHFKSHLLDQNYQRYATSPFSSLNFKIRLVHELSAITRALPSGQSLIRRSGAPFHSDQIEPNHVPIAAEAPELFEVQILPIVYLSIYYPIWLHASDLLF